MYSYVKPDILDASPSNKTISDVTAEVAGRVKCVAGWRKAREESGRLEVLLKHTRNLGELGCGTALDERLGALRTKRHLAGKSARIEVSEKLQQSKVTSEICWRNVQDVRQATNASIKHIRKGLLLARKKVVTLREEALAMFQRRKQDSWPLGSRFW